jgi:RecA-family ATPase
MSTGNGRDLHTMSVRELQQHTARQMGTAAERGGFDFDEWMKTDPGEQLRKDLAADYTKATPAEQRAERDRRRALENEAHKLDARNGHQHNGQTHHGRKARGDASDESTPAPTAPLAGRSVWDILETEPQPRCWHIPDWLPGDDVGGLFGDGGEGKTQLGLQLAWCTATGMDWLGLKVRAGPALYMSAEEPEPELDYRLSKLASGIVVPSASPCHAFEVVSRAQDDALLCTFTRTGIIQPTPLWNEIVEKIGDLKLSFLGIDAAADVFGGDENQRPQVRAFIAMLRRPAIEHQCAVLLMGHPSRDGMRTGLGYSGSTAWHNSLRARWYFTTPATGNEPEPHQDLRCLSLNKTNRGRRGQNLMLRWRDGWFGLAQGDGADPMKLAGAKTRFLELLTTYAKQGRNVSHKPTARNYAPTTFANDNSGTRFSRDLYADAMNVLFSEGRLGVGMSPGPESRASERLETR